jgi:GTPase SAR1 family protein
MAGQPKSVSVALVGGRRGGKSSIVQNITEGRVNPAYEATGPVQYSQKTLRDSERAPYATLKFWDIGVSELKAGPVMDRVRNADEIWFVYDASDPNSLNSNIDWYNHLLLLSKVNPGNLETANLKVIANKTDALDNPKNAQSIRDGQEFAKQIGAEFSAVSAKTEQLEFKLLAPHLQENLKEDTTPEPAPTPKVKSAKDSKGWKKGVITPSFDQERSSPKLSTDRKSKSSISSERVRKRDIAQKMVKGAGNEVAGKIKGAADDVKKGIKSAADEVAKEIEDKKETLKGFFRKKPKP